MKYFLAKTDPDTYSIDDLEQEKKTVWDGVLNPQAVRNIREMRPGDKVFIYHSQWSMFHFTGRITLSMHIRYFLEFKGAFKSCRKSIMAANK